MASRTLPASFPPVKRIPSYPCYSISEDGRVFSHLNRKGRKWRGPYKLSERPVHEMSCHTGVNGYATFVLACNGKWKSVQLASLLLDAFVSQRQPGMFARHLDDNPHNNDLSNLAWGTPLDNVNDAIRNGTFPHGEKHGNSKITDEDVRNIRLRHQQGESTITIARDCGVKKSMVWNIVARKFWRHVA